jgi:hypothetical protein
MGKFFVAAASIALSACTHGQAASSGRFRIACPELPASSGYAVTPAVGLDAANCLLSPLGSKGLAAEAYIGNFPSPEPTQQFVGFTQQPSGSLAWFSAKPASPSQSARWITYIPTGQEFPRVIKLVVKSNSRPAPGQLAHMAELVVNGIAQP